MKLHTYGLLRNSFRPSQEIRTMRTYWRQEDLLFQLKQEQDGFEFCLKPMAECDEQLQRYLEQPTFPAKLERLSTISRKRPRLPAITAKLWTTT